MNNPEDLLNEYKRLRDGDEREQYVTQEPMSLDEVDRLSNMMNEYKGVEVTPEQQTALQETELAADIASMEPNPEPVIDANEEQKVIDNMSFRDAFEQHYEKVKDLPVSQRPNLLWNKTEYKPVKAEESEPDTDLSKTSIERPKEEPKKEDDFFDKLNNRLIKLEGSSSDKGLSDGSYTGTKGKPNSRVKGSNNLYYDSEGKLTAGTGHLVNSEEEAKSLFNLTDKQIEDLRHRDINSRLVAIRKKIPSFDKFPTDTKLALMSSWFRGSLPKSPKTIALINKGKYKEASKEFLDNQEYRDRKSGKKKKGNIVSRMEETARQLAKLK